MRKITFIIVMLIGLCLSLGVFAADNNSQSNKKNTIVLRVGSPYIEVDNETVKIDEKGNVSPVILDGRVMVPIRVIIEKLGGTIVWDENEKRTDIKLNDKEISMWLNRKNIMVNNKNIEIDTAPKIINERTMLPIRFVADNLNCQIQWDAGENKVKITYIKNEEKTEEKTEDENEIKSEENNQPEYMNEDSSFFQGGKAVEINGCLYYKEDENIYKIENESGIKAIFSSDLNAAKIWTNGEWIYYCTLTTDKHSGSGYYPYYTYNSLQFYKVKPDGTNKTLIIEISVSKDKIICNLQNSPFPSMEMTKDKIFFILDRVYYQVDIANNNMQIICIDNERAIDRTDYSFNYYTRRVYSNEYYLYSGLSVGRMGSNDKTEIIKEEMVSYDINNGWVYYLNLKKELYKIRVDGSGKQLLATGLPLGKIKVFRDNILVYLDKEIYKVESDGKCKVISGKFESDISEFTYGFIYAVTDHWVLYRDFNKKSYKYTLYRVKIDGTSKEERLSDYTG